MLGLLGVLTAAICANVWEQPQGTRQLPVPVTPPDSTPAFASDPAYIVKLPTSRIAWVRDLLVVQFAAAATQLHKDSIIASVAGVVVGGKPSSMEGGGFYFVRLPADTTHARLTAAESALRSGRLVRRAVRYFSMDFDPTSGLASDGAGGRNAGVRAGAQQAAVPATAPDSLPTSLINSLPLLTDESGNQHRSQLVLLSFRSGTPQPARQAAITRIGGVVIGGKAGIQMEGWYLVRVARATSIPAIRSVTARLRAEPSVELVGPFTLGFPDDESRRPSNHARATQQQVPAVPPDTLPGDFAHDSNVVTARALAPYPFIRDVVWVEFKSRASTAAKSLAISKVNGIVIGGYRIGQSGGMYAVKLPKDPTHQATFRARDLLASDGAVASAMLEFLFTSRPTYATYRVRPSLLAQQATQRPVPAQAPDTVPQSLIRSLPSFPDSTGRILRAEILTVSFLEGTSQTQKQDAVAAIGSEVIGGLRADPDEGLYYLRVRSATTLTRLLDAFFVLEGLPQVAVVYLLDAGPAPRLESSRSEVSATPPDSTPEFVFDPAFNVQLPGSRISFARDLLVVQFASSTTQWQRDSLVASVAGIVVGGSPSSMEGGGFYLVRLPADTTHSRLMVAESALRSSRLVRRAVRYFSMDFDPTSGLANDGPAGRNAGVGAGAQEPAVPATAPDSLPTSLINSLPLLTDESGNQHRSQLVMLSFFERASQPARQAVIRSVGGMVVGGKAGIQEEGWYLVRVASATSMAAIDSVVARLRASPSVELVGPFTLGFPDDESRQSGVPAMALDSVPFSALSRLYYPANGGWSYAQDVLMLRFRLGTPVGERSRMIRLVSGTVIGGKRDITAEGGVYVIGLPRDTSQATLLAARDVLRRESAVLTEWLYEFAPIDPTNRIPNDGLDRSAQGPWSHP